ncbi:MAG: GH3 auxin-responsive promoter family protein [Chloroflexi bacterium]|nr:GH3 auxin-responsive promoter family protein [Chloroflexota bacterium]
MSTEILEMLRQGREQDVWKQYCSFLDLSLPEFMAIQERLLLEQLHEVGKSELGKDLMKEKTPLSLDEFRTTVPLTEYTDYQPYMAKGQEHTLPRETYIWAHTSGRSGGYKMVPYTKEIYEKAGDRIMSSFILAMARHRGDVRLEENDVLLYNVPAAPYASGVALLSVAERFPFHFMPSLEETEDLSFQERMELSFQKAMVTGIDVLGSITSVLVKIGERFAQGAGGARLSRYILHPKAVTRLTRGFIRSRLAGRAMLPKDIWTVKGITCGGTDTSIYKEKIKEYWGVTPHELYASTETGVVAAVQAWDRDGLYFFPDVVFIEFIPEEEWSKNRQDSTYEPKTVLLDEVELNQRYELVITSLHGGPFLRYRMRDLIRFVSLENEAENIKLPSMYCAGRSDGLIDLAGFTGLIDESMIWRAIHDTGISYEEWTARKEVSSDGAFLHLYLEPREEVSAEEVRKSVHDNLKKLNPFYADLEDMLEVTPLLVTLLSPGTFTGYYLEQQAAGADLAHLKPPHMNASDKMIDTLMRLSAAAA